MADFPSKVSTETSVSQPHSSQPARMAGPITVQLDVSFIKSIPGILMVVEMLLGLIQWALIASVNYGWAPAFIWVMFVAVGLWITTTILYVMTLFSIQQRLTGLPWPILVMVYNGVATVLYFIAFVVNAAFVNGFLWAAYSHMAAAAAFGAFVTLAYGASTFFSFLSWREDGGSPPTTTVPT
ncbi:plasmolipin [Stegastes partitus]|uniref:Plasmolipin n=1 Tax=Stegastes partitus TaxID=144197 RepID=A0A9Y4K2F8_9TELE|nr:PREDICTED: plasmolipin [Stegastes partitus]